MLPRAAKAKPLCPQLQEPPETRTHHSTSHRECATPKPHGQLPGAAFQSSKAGLFSCQIPQLGSQPPTKIKLCPKYSQKQNFTASSCEHQPHLNPTPRAEPHTGGTHRTGRAASRSSPQLGWLQQQPDNAWVIQPNFPRGHPKSLKSPSRIPASSEQRIMVIVTRLLQHILL